MKGRQQGRPTKWVSATMKEHVSVGKPGVKFGRSGKRIGESLARLQLVWAVYAGGRTKENARSNEAGMPSPNGSHQSDLLANLRTTPHTVHPERKRGTSPISPRHAG